MNDLKFACRQLLKNPGFAAIAILTLALGIGANTAIFSVINAVLLRPLPYPESQRLMILNESDANQPSISVSYPDYVDWKADNSVFAHLAISRRESFSLSGLEGRDPEQISGGLVTANFFDVIGLQPQLGRVFTAEEDRPGGAMVVVISDRLWQRVFDRDPNILGTIAEFRERALHGHRRDAAADVLAAHGRGLVSDHAAHGTAGLAGAWQSPRAHGWGRLKPGVTREQAQSEMSAIADRLAKAYPNSNTKVGVNVTMLLDNQVGEYRTSLGLLLIAVALVLLIACANLANLLAARGAARAREFAVRAAVGASRGQIIRQLLTESLLISLVGGALGVLLAYLGRDALIALAPAGVPRFQQVRLDAWVLAFAFALALVTNLVFGLWPAWQASRADIHLALKSGAHGSSDTPAARRTRNLLVVAEVAVTLVLLSAAGLVLKSFAKVQALPLGFEPSGLLTARVLLPQASYGDSKKVIRFSEELVRRVRELPGVSHAAIGVCPPLMTGWQTSFLPEGMPEPGPGQAPSLEMEVVLGDYFAALKVPILRGRAFNEQDTLESTPVIIVDQNYVDRFYPDQDPLGKQVRMSGEKDFVFRTIVGVTPRLKLYGFEDSAALPRGYLAQTQVGNDDLVLLVRSSAAPRALEKPIRQIVTSLDPAQPASEFRTMQERVEETWSTPRLMTFLLLAFAGLALVLSVVGLYGVMAFNGVRRTREMGVRLALGARPGQVRGLILGQGMKLFVLGLAAGLVGAVVMARVIRSLLFEVGAADPWIFGSVTVLLGLAALLACWLPARRASRVDPIITLRSE